MHGNSANLNERVFKYTVITWGVLVSLFHIYIALISYYEPFVVVPLHILLIGSLGFMCLNWEGQYRKKFDKSFLFDLLLIIVLIIVIYNPVHDPGSFQDRYAALNTSLWDKFCGLTTIILVLELTRRAVGKALVIFTILLLLYAVYGRYFPGVFRHGGVSFFSMAEYQYFSDFGLWSIVRIIAMYVMLFIVFGSLINESKAGLLIQLVGNKLFGASPGGPAKVAVATSAGMATISGSAVANVVTTGSFTIPMMKRVGYPAYVAGAVEAAASSGGQIMPPIMGAVAFVMADVLSIPYSSVCLAAAIPAILYFYALFVMIDSEARLRKMLGLPKEELPSRKEILELIHIAIPILLLIATMAAGYSVMRAGLIAIFSTLIFAMFRKSTRLSLSGIISALYTAARTTIVVSASCAAAGIIVGVVHQTGIGLRLSGQILELTHGFGFLGLIVIALISLMLGMGMPTVPAYVITIAVGSSILLKLGFVPVAVHMFILYYAVISCITPPIMVASYAAASVANANVWKVGLHAVKLAYIKYIIPFIFIYSPAILIVAVPTTISQIIIIFISALIGTYAITVALAGYFYKNLIFLEKVFLIVAGLLMVIPGYKSDAIGFILFLLFLLHNKEVRNKIAYKFQNFYTKRVS